MSWDTSLTAPATKDGMDLQTSLISLPEHITPSTHFSGDLIQGLMKLQRAAQLITSTLDLDPLLQRVVNDLAAAIGCVDVAVWLRADDADEMVLRGARTCNRDKKGSRLKIGCEGMVGRTAATGRLRYAPDVRIDPDYISCDPEIRAELDIPLTANEKVIGVFSVSHTEPHAFSEADQRLIEALAGHVAVAVENARIFARERRERERMLREAEEARLIQQALFGKPVPLVPGFAFETAWCPAGSLGGDWYDFIDLGQGMYGIVLADVSGKGMPAALLMTATRAVLRSIARLHRAPGETLARMNEVVTEDFPTGKFVTMLYGVLETRSREFTLASAGHPRPLLINHACSFLNIETGLPLGLGASIYPEYTLKLETDTHLLLYSDGVTEAMDERYEEYGPNRLADHFLRPGASVKGLIQEIRAFGAGSDVTDDATAVLIRSR